MHLPESRTALAGFSCPTCDCANSPESCPGGFREAGGMFPFCPFPQKWASTSWQRVTPQAERTQSPPPVPGEPAGRGGLPCPSTVTGRSMCCYSNGRISDEWGKLFLLLSRLQKETKTPFTSANNALMWAPAPCSLHRPSSVQTANHHSGLWGHSQRVPFPSGQPTPAPKQS